MERVLRVQLGWLAPESVARHLAGEVRGLRVLDYGCGEGALLGRMSQAGHRVGVDVSAAALARSRERLGPGPGLVQIGLAGPLPFAPAVFDLVTSTEVLEHVPDERIMLAEIARVLRPGGTLVLTTPHRHRLSVLDPGNLKFRFPRLHGWFWKVIRRMDRAEYARRYRGAEGLIGDISVQERPWHRHYSLEELAVLTAGLFELQRVFIFGPWTRLLKPLRLATRTRLPSLARLLRNLDHRSRVSFHRQGFDICIVARKRSSQRDHRTMEK